MINIQAKLSLPVLLLTLWGCGDAVTTAPPLAEPDAGPARAQSASAVYPVPSTIAANCTADVTQALQNWIASVPNHSTLRFAAGACYIINGGLTIDDRHGLVFEGNGATFRVVTRGAPDRSNFTFRGGSQLTLRDLTLRGANPRAGTGENAYDPALEWQHGIRLRGVQGALLERLQVYDVYGDFISLNHDGRVARPGPPNRDVTIRGGHFERSGRQGIAITHGERIWIQDNYIGHTPWWGVDLELNDDLEVGRDIWVERNTFGPSRKGFFASMGHGKGSSVGRVYIRHNQTTRDHPMNCDSRIAIGWPDWAGERAAAERWKHFTIEDNRIYALRRNRVARLAAIEEVEFRRNTIVGVEGGTSACGTDGPVDLRDSHAVRITDNTIEGEATPMWGRVYVADALSTGITEQGNTILHPTSANMPPTADFSSACTEASCVFTDQSTDPDGRVVAWHWSFGNGSTSTAQHPSTTYSAAGSYTVTQTVTDDEGLTATTSRTISCLSRNGRIRCA